MPNRWSPSVVAEAPRNAGMGAAMFGSAAMDAYGSLEELRDRRRQRELQAEENASQAGYRQASLANDAARLGVMRDEVNTRKLSDEADYRLKLAQAGAQEGEPPTGNSQAGSTVANAETATEESDIARITRKATELYPKNIARFQHPESGKPYWLDANQKAREAAIQQMLKDAAEESKGNLAHKRAMEIEAERTKRALEAARIRGSQRGRSGGGGGAGAGAASDGVSPTQMTGEINKMNTAFAGIQRRRGALMKSPQNNPESNLFNEEIATGIWDQFRADSAATVDGFRPENNPRMAAAEQRYGIPQTATPFFDTGPIPEQEVQTRMASLTMARDRAKNPQQRAQANKLLQEYAQQVNQRGMQR